MHTVMCIDMCMDMGTVMCIDMCMDMGTAMCIDMCMDMGTVMCIDMGIDMQTVICIHMCINMHTVMCSHMCRDMCIDICIGKHECLEMSMHSHVITGMATTPWGTVLVFGRTDTEFRQGMYMCMDMSTDQHKRASTRPM